MTAPNFLSVGYSCIREAGLGVWTEKCLPQGIVFGPYEGDIIRKRFEAKQSGYAWEIRKGGRTDHFIEGRNQKFSNWLRYVNCANVEEKQNLVAFQYRKQVYYRTYKPVLEYTELFVWYGDSYGRELVEQFKKKVALCMEDGQRELTGVECAIKNPLSSSPKVMEQNNQQMKPDKRHRCSHCAYSTDRADSLRRHLLVHDSVKKSHNGETPFKCDICGKEFKEGRNLRRHERIHSEDKPHLCSECGKKFHERRSLVRHIQTHTGQRPYKCIHCPYRSSRSTRLREHVIINHTKDYPHVCEECGKGFTRTGEMHKHKIKEHSDSAKNSLASRELPGVECDICHSVCSSTEMMEMHRKSHSHMKQEKSPCTNSTDIADRMEDHPSSHDGVKSHKCSECGLPFTQNHSLVCHIRTHLENKPLFTDELPRVESHTCDACGKEFTRKDNLIQHVCTHTGERPFRCNMCGKAFIEKRSLRRHEVIHTGEKPFRCDACGMAFTQKRNLRRHEVIHTGEKKFRCDACGKAFTEKRGLSRHEMVHTGEKPFRCDKCGMAFTEKRSLRRHEMIHTGERPFRCDACGKSFTDKRGLSRHEMIHTGEKPFRCDTCGMAFTEKRGLSRHGKIHTGEKAFRCDTCGKDFTGKGDLTRHLRIHSAQKSYRCTQCTYESSYSSSLRLHIIACHTKNYPHVCEECGKGFTKPGKMNEHKSKEHTNVKKIETTVSQSQ
ncbi:zinc finger protein 260-like [Uloborus diversus]|uniref:zinc finger protein 260-like n=1 Tax=Uloborus diversus TaxID=327109 RepID=UPI0024096447|nr:zinc finger protein 260-like [Uloborus diversus]